MTTNLKNLLKSLALADAIIEPEWEYRYFSYDSNWAENEEMASMRDGQGGYWFVLFQEDGIAYKCISPEDGLIDNLTEIKNKIPEKYTAFINEPAFYVDEATSIWIHEEGDWIKFGKSKTECIIDLTRVINWTAKNYKNWAEEHYETNINLEALKDVFQQKISQEIICKINPELSLPSIKKDIEEIGIKL